MVLQSGNYVLDTQHPTVRFAVRYAIITKIHGQSTESEFVINLDADNPKNFTARTAIQVNSINTNDEKRNNHLRSKDFFGIGENPTFEFASTTIEFQSKERAIVTGDLTINGITKPVVLDVDIFGSAEDPQDQTRVGFGVVTKINRTDFDVDYSTPIKIGGLLLDNKISLQTDGSAVKQ